MKKFLTILITAVLLSSTLSGCKNYHARFYGGDICDSDETRKGKMPKDAFKPTKAMRKRPKIKD